MKQSTKIISSFVLGAVLVIGGYFYAKKETTLNIVGGAGGISTGIYESSAPTLANHAINPILLDVNGNQKVVLASNISGENQTTNRMNTETIWTYTNIVPATATGTLIGTGAGTLGVICVNAPTSSMMLLTTTGWDRLQPLWEESCTLQPFLAPTQFVCRWDSRTQRGFSFRHQERLSQT